MSQSQSQSQSRSQSQRQHHRRTSSHGRKVLPPHARAVKPPLVRRAATYNYSPSQSPHAPASHPQSKSLSGWSNRIGSAEASCQHGEEEDGGMTSFLQFCATCEKQIIIPGASVLYCSEFCRKKDVSQPTSVQSLESLEGVKSSSGLSNISSYFNHPPVDIIPQRSPTVLQPLSMTFSELSLPDVGNHTDPSSEGSEVEDRQSWQQLYQDTNRQTTTRKASTTTDSNLPSLVHSPSSAWGTVASNASYRHLVPRHDPFSTDCHHGSIDLVIPSQPDTPTTQLLKGSSLESSASTLTTLNIAEAADTTFYRTSSSSTQGSNGEADGSLKRLFGHDAAKVPPRIAY